MNFSLYKSRMSDLEAHSDNLVIKDDELLNRTLCFTSANLGNYLPDVPFNMHENFLKSILLNREKGLLDGKFSDVLSLINYENLNDELWTLLRGQPSVIYSFHMGSMQLINHFLAYNKIDYVFIASRKMLNEHLGDFLEMAEFQKLVYGDLTLTYIEADEPASALKMLRALKNGKHLLVYVDGNTGVGKDIGNPNLCRVNFFSKSLYVRRGVATLAILGKVPLIGVVCYRDDNKRIMMRFINPIYPDTQLNKAEESQKLMQYIYDQLAPILKLYPEQWECWIYLHSFINSKEFEYHAPMQSNYSTVGYDFNHNDYGLYVIKKEFYLFCKRNYFSYLIDASLYEFLRNFREGNESKSIPVKKLIENGVLLTIKN